MNLNQCYRFEIDLSQRPQNINKTNNGKRFVTMIVFLSGSILISLNNPAVANKRYPFSFFLQTDLLKSWKLNCWSIPRKPDLSSTRVYSRTRSPLRKNGQKWQHSVAAKRKKGDSKQGSEYGPWDMLTCLTLFIDRFAKGRLPTSLWCCMWNKVMAYRRKRRVFFLAKNSQWEFQTNRRTYRILTQKLMAKWLPIQFLHFLLVTITVKRECLFSK